MLIPKFDCQIKRFKTPEVLGVEEQYQYCKCVEKIEDALDLHENGASDMSVSVTFAKDVSLKIIKLLAEKYGSIGLYNEFAPCPGGWLFIIK